MSRDGRETVTTISEVRTDAQSYAPQGGSASNLMGSFSGTSGFHTLHRVASCIIMERLLQPKGGARSGSGVACACLHVEICATEDLDPFYPTPLCACSSRISAGSRIFVWYWPLPLPEAAPMGKYSSYPSRGRCLRPPTSWNISHGGDIPRVGFSAKL